MGEAGTSTDSISDWMEMEEKVARIQAKRGVAICHYLEVMRICHLEAKRIMVREKEEKVTKVTSPGDDHPDFWSGSGQEDPKPCGKRGRLGETQI